MKKITLFAFLMISVFSYCQTSYTIYTENATIGAGNSFLRFSNGQGLSGSEVTTAPYEGTKNYQLLYNGTSTYVHGIFIARNAGNTGDVAIDMSSYSFYNVSIKTVSAAPFYIRMRGNTITAKVLIDPASNGYGFKNDGKWHFMSIPYADFIPESGTFSFANVTEAFVLRSNAAATLVGTGNNDFEIDNIYVSTTKILGVNNFESNEVSMYPNPASNSFKIRATNTIDRITIYNTLGQKMQELSPNKINENIDISSLKNGLYFIQVESEGKSVTSKLIKN
jgi:hypothetical protein